MELELGLKITQTRDDVSSSTNLHIAKDPAGPVFLSRETRTMFILTAHLKDAGYRKEMFEIEINEDGSRIVISGKKPVREVMKRQFRKVFRIPDGVNLDRIKAKFNAEESILRIVMPKLVKGVRGGGIEEVEEEEEVDRGKAKTAQMVAEDVPERRECTAEALKEEPKAESKMEETDHVAKMEVDKVLEEGDVRERIKEDIKEPKIESMEEADRNVAEPVDEVKLEAEKAPERDSSIREMLQEESKQPEVKNMEETGHVAKIEVDKVFEGGDVPERMKEEIKDPKIESMDETGRIVAEPVDEGKLEATKVEAEKSPERDSSIREMQLQEESKQPEVKNIEETEHVVEEKTEREDISGKKPIQVETSQETQEIEHQSIEPKQPTAEIISSKELPDLKEQTKRQATPEESRIDELPDLKEQTEKHAIPKAEKVIQEDVLEEHIPSPESAESTKGAADQVSKQSELTNQLSTQETQVEGQHITDEIHQGEMPQEPQKQENGTEVQETTKIKPDQDETRGVENEIQEATDHVKHPDKNVVDEHEPAGKENQKEGEDQTNEAGSKGATPLVVAGSAFLASLIVIAVTFLSSRKSPESTESTKAAADQVSQQSELTNQLSTQETQVEGQHVTDEIHQGEMPQEPQKQENGTEVQETTKIKPDQEETRGVENEIQEATDQVKHPDENVVDEHEPAGMEKQKDVIEGPAPTKESGPTGSYPLFVAGSAFIVSLIAIAVTFLSSRKR